MLALLLLMLLPVESNLPSKDLLSGIDDGSPLTATETGFGETLPRVRKATTPKTTRAKQTARSLFRLHIGLRERHKHIAANQLLRARRLDDGEGPR